MAKNTETTIKNKAADIDLQFTFPEEAEDKVSKWADFVPIIEKDGIVTAYLSDDIEVPAMYNELCYTLEHTDAKKVILKINNGGGHIDSFLAINSAIRKSRATVVADIVGTVASAATMITLSCDEVIIDEHIQWMSHFYSGGAQGKGNEIIAQSKFMEKEMPKMFKKVHDGFFTASEIKKMIDGSDYWLNADDVRKRWDKMKATRGKK